MAQEQGPFRFIYPYVNPENVVNPDLIAPTRPRFNVEIPTAQSRQVPQASTAESSGATSLMTAGLGVQAAMPGLFGGGSAGGLGLGEGMHPLAAAGLALSSAAGGIKGDFLLPIVMLQHQAQAKQAQEQSRRANMETMLNVLDRAHTMKLPLAQRKALGQQADAQFPGLGALFEYTEQDFGKLREQVGQQFPAIRDILAAAPNEFLPSVLEGLLGGLSRVETAKKVETETELGRASVRQEQAAATTKEAEALASTVAPETAIAELDKLRTETALLQEQQKTGGLNTKDAAQVANLRSEIRKREFDMFQQALKSAMFAAGKQPVLNPDGSVNLNSLLSSGAIDDEVFRKALESQIGAFPKGDLVRKRLESFRDTWGTTTATVKQPKTAEDVIKKYQK